MQYRTIEISQTGRESSFWQVSGERAHHLIGFWNKLISVTSYFDFDLSGEQGSAETFAFQQTVNERLQLVNPL